MEKTVITYDPQNGGHEIIRNTKENSPHEGNLLYSNNDRKI